MDEQLSSQVQGCLVTAQREAGARLGPALTLGPVVVGSVHFTQECLRCPVPGPLVQAPLVPLQSEREFGPN